MDIMLVSITQYGPHRVAATTICAIVCSRSVDCGFTTEDWVTVECTYLKYWQGCESCATHIVLHNRHMHSREFAVRKSVVKLFLSCFGHVWKRETA